MSDREALTSFDAATLAAAFPLHYRTPALLAGADAAHRLFPRQWSERFPVQVQGDAVLIPARLHFASERTALRESCDSWRLARALQTRSNDGFERQRAARDLLTNIEPSTAPFIVTLIGEYIVEILDDILFALTPQIEQMLADFVRENPIFWETIKQRVASYWNAYHRARWIGDRAERRDEYVGFRLVQQIGSAVSRSVRSAAH